LFNIIEPILYLAAPAANVKNGYLEHSVELALVSIVNSNVHGTLLSLIIFFNTSYYSITCDYRLHISTQRGISLQFSVSAFCYPKNLINTFYNQVLELAMVKLAFNENYKDINFILANSYLITCKICKVTSR